MVDCRPLLIGLVFLPLAEAAEFSRSAAWAGPAFSAAVLLAGLGLALWNVLGRRRFQRRGPREPGETAFRQSQFRRRLLTAGLCSLVGLLMLIGTWWPGRDASAYVALSFWGFVTLLVLWMLLTALADMLASWHYFGKLTDEAELEQLKLRVLAERLRRIQGNGKDDAALHAKKPPASAQRSDEN
ncbi:hypothetical protein [Thermopirellula anaerolimosa]